MKKHLILSLAMAAFMAAPALAQGTGAPAGGPGAGADATAGGGGPGGGAGGGRGFRHGGGSGGERGGKRFERVKALLNDQQKAQFEQIMEQSRAEGRPLMQKMAAMRQQMQGGTNMDDKTKADFVQLRKQLQAHHEAVRAKINGLLTADQKAQLETTGGMPEFGGPGGGEGGPGGGPGGGWGGRRRARGGGGSDFNSPATPPLPSGGQ